MKIELLTRLLPKSVNYETTGSKNHNAITPEDINTIMSYCRLTDKETAMILVRFLGDNTYRSKLYNSFYKEAAPLFIVDEIKESVIRNIVDCAFLETAFTRCPFCNGVGYRVSLNEIEDCLHCNDGVFVFTEKVKIEIIGIKKNQFKQIKEKYKKIMSMIQDLENSALSKIGDANA